MEGSSANVIQEFQCRKIIENYLRSTDFQINGFSVESLKDTVTGMMAEYYTIKISFVKNGKVDSKQFFCKKLIMFHKIQEIMGKAQGAYEKEEFIYNFLIPECRKMSNYEIKFAPNCYLTVSDDMLVFEDLSIQNYKIVPCGHDLDHCKIALKTIAKFHASSVIYEEKISITKGNKYSLNDEYRHIFQDSLYRKNESYLGRHWFKNTTNTLFKIVEISDWKDNLKLKQNLEKYQEKIYETFGPSSVFNNVLCHGDLSFVNIMFQHDPKSGLPTDCKLVDFQALRYTPPAHDVLTYIYLSVDSEFRKKHLNDLLECYYLQFHHELDEHCVDKEKHIVLAKFRESCDYVLPGIVMQAMCYLTMVPIKYFPKIKLDQDLYKKYVYDDRSSECIEIYREGGFFKNKMDEYFQEFSKL